MKTLKELNIPPSYNLANRMEGLGLAEDLTPLEAVKEEIAWRFGDSAYFGWFERLIKQYGGQITFPDGVGAGQGDYHVQKVMKENEELKETIGRVRETLEGYISGQPNAYPFDRMGELLDELEGRGGNSV